MIYTWGELAMAVHGLAELAYLIHSTSSLPVAVPARFPAALCAHSFAPCVEYRNQPLSVVIHHPVFSPFSSPPHT